MRFASPPLNFEDSSSSFVDLTAGEKQVIDNFQARNHCQDDFFNYLVTNVSSWDELMVLKNGQYSAKLFQKNLDMDIKQSFMHLWRAVFPFGQNSDFNVVSAVKSTLRTRLLFKQIHIAASSDQEIKLIFRLNAANPYVFAVARCQVSGGLLKFVFEHTANAPGIIFSDFQDGTYTVSAMRKSGGPCFLPESIMITDKGVPQRSEQSLLLCKSSQAVLKKIAQSSPEGECFDPSLEIKFSSHMRSGKFAQGATRNTRLVSGGLNVDDVVPGENSSAPLFTAALDYAKKYSAWFVLPRWYLYVLNNNTTGATETQQLVKATCLIPIYKLKDGSTELCGTPKAFYALKKNAQKASFYYNVATIFDSKMVLEDTTFYSNRVRDMLILMNKIPIEEALLYKSTENPFAAAAAARRSQGAGAIA